MGYSPDGIQGDAIRMSERKQALKEILGYLAEHPNEEYKGYSLKTVQQAIERIENFNFMS